MMNKKLYIFLCMMFLLVSAVSAANLSSDKNMLLYYKLDGNYSDSFDGNTGTPSGDLSFGNGILNQGLYLAGSDDEVVLPDNIYTTNNPISVSVWINNSGNTDRGDILGMRDNAKFIITLGQGLNNELSVWHDGTWHNTGVIVPVDVWVHIAYTMNSSGDTLVYYNGSVVDSWTQTYNAVEGLYNILGGDSGVNNGFAGGIDEVGLWNNTELSGTEISYLWNNSNALAYPLTIGSTPTNVTNDTLSLGIVSPADDYVSDDFNVSFSAVVSPVERWTNVSLYINGSINLTENIFYNVSVLNYENLTTGLNYTATVAQDLSNAYDDNLSTYAYFNDSGSFTYEIGVFNVSKDRAYFSSNSLVQFNISFASVRTNDFDYSQMKVYCAYDTPLNDNLADLNSFTTQGFNGSALINFTNSSCLDWDNDSIVLFFFPELYDDPVYLYDLGLKNNITVNFSQTFTSGLYDFYIQANDTSTGVVSSTRDFLVAPYLVEFNSFEIVSNLSISNFTISAAGIVNTSLFNISTTNGSVSRYYPAGTFYINWSNKGGYYNRSNISFVVSANTTINISDLFNHKISFFGENSLTGTSLLNFSVNASNSLYGFNQRLSTTGNNITFNLTRGLNFSFVFDKFNFSYDYYNTTIPNNFSSSHTFRAFTTNSLNISFYYASNGRLANDTTVSVSFIGLSAFSSSTSNGTLYVDLFTPDTYTITYNASGYRQGSYIVSIANRSYQELSLYLALSNQSQLILLTVSDLFGNPVEGAEITVQRYINNSWRTEQILATDFQGRSEGYFILSTVFYNFLISYNDIVYQGVINSDEDKKVIYAEDVVTGLNFFIDLTTGSGVAETLSALGVSVNLSYVNLSDSDGYFRYYFNDVDNLQRSACLEVEIVATGVAVCSCDSTSVNSESGVLSCIVNRTNMSRAYYQSHAYIDGQVVDSLLVVVGESGFPSFGSLGFILSFVLVLLAVFIFAKSSPAISVVFGSVVFVTVLVLGLAFQGLVSYTVHFLVLFIGGMVAFFRSKSGVNA